MIRNKNKKMIIFLFNCNLILQEHKTLSNEDDLNKYLESKKHNVDPMVLENEVKITPDHKPKSAPASRVINTAMGKASAVTMM